MLGSLRTDIPFDREDAHTLLPWIIGFTVCLTGLLLAAALSIGGHLRESGDRYIHSFQVQIPYAEGDMTSRVSEVVQLLQSMEQIDTVTELHQEDMLALIAPWVGSSFDLSELPLPVMLEVTTKTQEEQRLEHQRLEATLQEIAADIDVQSHESWVANFMQFTNTLNMIALLLSLLLLGSLTAMVVLAARTSLKLHFKTVSILHTIGAEDPYIIRQFTLHGLQMVLKGAICGAVIACGLYMLLGAMAANLDSPLLPVIDLTLLHAFLFLLLPFFTAAVAWVAVKLTIGRMLEQMH